MEVTPVTQQAGVLVLKKAMETQSQGAQVVLETLARTQQSASTAPASLNPDHLGQRIDLHF